MTRWRATSWIAVFSALAVVLVGLVDIRRTSPGPLSAVHGRVSELASSNACSECHGGWFSGMSESCSDCHERIAEQIEAHDGLHGALAAETALRCSLCHSEHQGASFPVVNRRSFALAGVDDPRDFEHRLVGFAMDGEHLALECTKCHEHAAAEVLDEGAQRFGGLDQECSTCHEDVHEGRFELACTACHGQQAFDVLHSEGHERRLPLVGGHAELDCRRCHAADGEHALERVGDPACKPAARACADCHESPHDERFSAEVASSIGSPPAAACVECHHAEHASFSDANAAVTAEMHAHSGFALAAPHDQAGCEDCHEPGLASFTDRYPGRGPDECSACHDDPHEGQFDEGPFSRGDCLACHERTHFEPHRFDVEHHARTALPLEGRHAAIECSECHADPAQDEARRFEGTPARCEQCHRDAHDGFFAPALAALPASPSGDCSHCHGAETFTLADEREFDHELWTKFAVAGAHAEAECEACHPRAEEPDALGRTFGRVGEHWGERDGCATCHEDPHEGRFDDVSLPLTVRGRRDCARCHTDVSFRALHDGFDHGRWTGFALTGEHAAAACSACHAPLPRPDEHGRTWDRALGTACDDCHDDPHARQFDRRGATDCARCHLPQLPRFLAFRHDRDSRFALGEAHAGVACDACHLTERSGELAFVRYRPVGRECTDCHDNDERLLLRRAKRRQG